MGLCENLSFHFRKKSNPHGCGERVQNVTRNLMRSLVFPLLDLQGHIYFDCVILNLVVEEVAQKSITGRGKQKAEGLVIPLFPKKMLFQSNILRLTFIADSQKQNP